MWPVGRDDNGQDYLTYPLKESYWYEMVKQLNRLRLPMVKLTSIRSCVHVTDVHIMLQIMCMGENESETTTKNNNLARC